MWKNISVRFHNEEEGEAVESFDNLVYDDGDDNWEWGDEEMQAATKIDPQSTTVDIQPGDEGAKERKISMTGLDDDFFSDNTLSGSSIESRVWDLESRLGQIRFRVHLVMDHIATRLFSILLVITDIILVLIALAINDTSDHSIYTPLTLAIVTYFMVELALRMFAWGKEFFHHRMEIADLVIIIVSFILTLITEIATFGEHAKYVKLILVFRLFRILLLARIYTGRKHLEKSTRNLISQNKRRYVKDGFDLDLTYVTERVIAMSFPSSGKLAMYRNPIEEVSRFFNTKHPDHYKLYNLCSERSYDATFFNDNVERVLIDDHNVPRLSQLLQFCHDVDDWMSKSERNIVAIHCKGGKGRTGTCVAAWLLYSGQFKTAEKALEFFGHRRTDKAKGQRFQGVETPSQSRYVGYLEQILKDMDGRLPAPKPLVFRSMKITGLKTIGNKDGSDLRMEVIINGRVVYELNLNVPIVGQVVKKDGEIKMKFNEDDSPVMTGDVKVKFYSSNPSVPKDYDDCAFFFWFHTSFIKNKKLALNRKEIGNAHKPKRWKLFTDKFGVVIKFEEPSDGLVGGAPNMEQF